MSLLTLGRPRLATRSVSGLASTALAVAGVGLLQPAPASADTPAPTLAWKVSQQFDGHLSTHTLADGATEDESGVVTFPDGVGSYNPGNGTATESYGGSVTGAFMAGGTQYYSVTIADPTVTVAADGSGQISAVVSAANIAAGPSPAASTDPTRVVVTRFQGGTWTADSALGSLSATPDWAGVLAAGSDGATALGVPAGQPVDGKSFAPEFLAQVTPGVRALFYASGSGSDPNKAPAAFTAQAAPSPAVTYTTGKTSYAAGMKLTVRGTGFSAVTQPGDAGVYVGVAPRGGLPDVSTQEGQDAFAATTWVMPSQIVDGSFTAALTVPTGKLDRDTTYAVYTWQAHTHSTTSQDTVTPIVVDWKSLRAPATLAAQVTKKPRPDRAGTLAVTATGAKGSGRPAGKVTVSVIRHGKVVKKLAGKQLTSGKVTFRLPAMAKGAVTLKAAYAGSADHLPAQTSRKVTVTKR